MQTTMPSIGITNGALCVVNGLTTQAERVQSLRKCIKNLIPFELDCDHLDDLCSAIIEEYEYEGWYSKLIWILGCLRHAPAYKGLSGSWNFPLRYVNDWERERECFKIIREHRTFKNNVLAKEYWYEFHQAPVIGNKWLEAEISGSPGLAGLKPKEQDGTGGRFHLLCNENSASAYLSTRTNTPWFTPQEAVMKKVRGRKFQTVDLVYVPPKTWVWGVDAYEMFVEL